MDGRLFTWVHHDGRRAFRLCRDFAQCQALLRNFKDFSSLKSMGLPMINYSDPPDHTRRRKVVNPAFTPKRTQMLNDNAVILIDSLIDGIMANGGPQPRRS